MLKGKYTITNAQSGRRMIARADHCVSAGVGGELFEDEIWRIERTMPEGSCTITNAHSGQRLFAKTGKDFDDGFGATMGPVYDDQKWYIQQSPEDSYAIINVLSNRRLFAHLKDGHVGAAAAANLLPEQAWYIQQA